MVVDYVRKERPKFIEMVQKSSGKAAEKATKTKQTEFNKLTARIAELDNIINQTFEDKVNKKISEDRFAKMLATFEGEQCELQPKADALNAELAELREKALDIDRFLKLVDECTEITELTADIARRFIKKVVVHEATYESYQDRKRARQRKVGQEIHVHYVCVDEINLE